MTQQPPTARPPGSWPLVFGVISIVLAGLGVLGHGCNVVFSLLAAAVQNVDANVAMGVPEGPLFWVLLVEYVVALALSGWLLVAGVGLVRRRAAGVRSHRAWAVAKIVTTLLGAAPVLLLFDDLVAAMAASFDSGGSGMILPARAFTIGMVGVSILLALAWPVVILAWLGRAAVRAEVRDWP